MRMCMCLTLSEFHHICRFIHIEKNHEIKVSYTYVFRVCCLGTLRLQHNKHTSRLRYAEISVCACMCVRACVSVYIYICMCVHVHIYMHVYALPACRGCGSVVKESEIKSKDPGFDPLERQGRNSYSISLSQLLCRFVSAYPPSCVQHACTHICAHIKIPHSTVEKE